MDDDNILTKVLDAVELGDAIVEYGVGPIGFLLKTLDPTPGFIAKRDKMLDDWWVAVVKQLNNDGRRLSALEQEQLRARFCEDEAIGILAGYVRATYEEPMTERQRMLQHAAASLANIRLGLADLARVQRVLRELEADDLIVLYGLWLANGRSERAQSGANGLAVLRLELWHASGAESLETAGCVRVEAKGGGAGVGTYEELSVTRTGRLVLRALRTYITARRPDLSTTPGHEISPNFRSEEEARAVIACVPGLYDILLAHRGIGFGPIQYSSITPARGLPANGKTKLILELPAAAAESLRLSTNREVAEHGQPVSAIFVDVISPTQSLEKVSTQIAGPHDVLRWLAYDLDAWWT